MPAWSPDSHVKSSAAFGRLHVHSREKGCPLYGWTESSDPTALREGQSTLGTIHPWRSKVWFSSIISWDHPTSVLGEKDEAVTAGLLM